MYPVTTAALNRQRSPARALPRPSARRRQRAVHAIVLILIFLSWAGCSDGEMVRPEGTAQDCETGFGPWELSAYVLPYPEGHAYRMSQGNCAKLVGAHGGKRRFAYDFDMPLGSPVIASRDGLVEVVIRQWPDVAGGRGQDNMVRINQGDGTFADYVHLMQDGALVEVGDIASQGDTIAFSGNSGYSAGPHLHFHVERYGTCTPIDPSTGAGGCQSVPVNFRNTDPNPTGLVTGRTYEAGSVG